MSLLLNQSYDIDCKVNITVSGEDATNRSVNLEDDMMRLAELVGKVLDITNKGTTTAYSKVLAIDLELNHFGSLMPLGPWEADAPLSKPPEKLGIKAMEMAIKRMIFFHAKLVLHLPGMLKFSTNLNFTHSRSSCLEAARYLLRFFQLMHKSELPWPAIKHRCSPHNLLGYAAAVAIILGQMGLVSSPEDPHQIQTDEALVKYAIETFHSMSTKIAEQSSSILKQLIQLRDRQANGEPVPTTLTIPLIGKITVPVILPKLNNPRDISNILSSHSQTTMPTSWPPLAPISTTIHKPQHPIYDPQDLTYIQSTSVNVLYSNDNLHTSNNESQFLNNNILYSNNNLLYSDNDLQYSINDAQFPNYDLEHLNYDLQYPNWDFQWESTGFTL
jgi:hypothetical protein